MSSSSKEDHESIMGQMKRRFFMWFAAMLAFFLAVLGFVVLDIQSVADRSCDSTNRIISTIVDYNNDVIHLQDEGIVRDPLSELSRLSKENNSLLEAARCKK